MLKKFMVIALLILILPTSTLGQLKSQRGEGNVAQALQPQRFIGLLNPEKFRMWHSYSMSVFSFGGRTFFRGLYLNTMYYRFSDPLSMKVQWGVLHQPFNMFGNPLNRRAFLSEVELNYRPSDKFLLRVRYGMMPDYPLWVR